MSDKSDRKIDPFIRDWKLIRTVLAARLGGKTRKEIGVTAKLSVNRLDSLVTRMRWTSQQTEGVGTVERNIATEFVAAWESQGPKPVAAHRPMSADEGKAVIDAIRMATGKPAEEPPHPDELVPPGIASLWPVESGA